MCGGGQFLSDSGQSAAPPALPRRRSFHERRPHAQRTRARQSGGGMDRAVEKSGLPTKVKIGLGAAGADPPARALLLFRAERQQPDRPRRAAHHLDGDPGPVRRFPAVARAGRALAHRLPRRGRGRPGRARRRRGRHHGPAGPAARGADQSRAAVERARPPDRGHPADQLDAQPGARPEPDPARQRAGADRGRSRHPDRAPPIRDAAAARRARLRRRAHLRRQPRHL